MTTENVLRETLTAEVELLRKLATIERNVRNVKGDCEEGRAFTMYLQGRMDLLTKITYDLGVAGIVPVTPDIIDEYMKQVHRLGILGVQG